MRTYDRDGYFVALKDGFGRKDGVTRHFTDSRRAVDFLASLQGGNREHGVTLISRRYDEEPAQMSLEVLAADGWPQLTMPITRRRTGTCRQSEAQ